MFSLAVSLAVIFFSSNAAIAFDGGFGGEGGCCQIPENKLVSAVRLVEQGKTMSNRELKMRLVLGEVCTRFECGVLNESEAKRVLEAAKADRTAWWNRVQKIALAVVAFSGLGLGLLNRYRPVP